MGNLRKRVENWNRARRATVDEPWGTSLAAVLSRDAPDLLAMLADECLDPTGYHAGSDRYAVAWARLDEVERQEAALFEEARRAKRREKLLLYGEAESISIDPAEHVDGLLPV